MGCNCSNEMKKSKVKAEEKQWMNGDLVGFRAVNRTDAVSDSGLFTTHAHKMSETHIKKQKQSDNNLYRRSMSSILAKLLHKRGPKRESIKIGSIEQTNEQSNSSSSCKKKRALSAGSSDRKLCVGPKQSSILEQQQNSEFSWRGSPEGGFVFSEGKRRPRKRKQKVGSLVCQATGSSSNKIDINDFNSKCHLRVPPATDYYGKNRRKSTSSNSTNSFSISSDSKRKRFNNDIKSKEEFSLSEREEQDKMRCSPASSHSGFIENNTNAMSGSQISIISSGKRSLTSLTSASETTSQTFDSSAALAPTGLLATTNNNTNKRLSTSSTVSDISSNTSTFLEANETTQQQNKINDNSIEDDIVLFTSIQQLCNQTIKKRLLSETNFNNQTNHNQGKVLCLFLFGCQGSNKGEIAYDLVQHSPLYKVLKNTLDLDKKSIDNNDYNNNGTDCCCPLYHHIDVASIIISNIDARIREYNSLLAKTIHIRKQQLALSESICNGDNFSESSDKTITTNVYIDEQSTIIKKNSTFTKSSSSFEEKQQSSIEDQEEEEDDEEVVAGDANATILVDELASIQSDNQSNNFIDPSIGSDGSSLNESTTSEKHKHLIKNSIMGDQTDDFGQITLSTKQRSILQLKLMKYYNSITSKWVFSLIKREIDKFELLIRKKYELIDNNNKSRIPNRVYLINLIPNQLNLFKSCLYLKQNSILKHELNYPYWAIKFEHRTNIKLLFKEHANLTNINQSNHIKQSQSTTKNLHLIIANLKFPIISIPSSSNLMKKQQQQSHSSFNDNNCNNKQGRGDKFTTMANDIIANSNIMKDVNEKLGPKFNENFSEQFKTFNKLIRMRYNPIYDYNYANKQDNNNDYEDDDDGENEHEEVEEMEEQSENIEFINDCPNSTTDRVFNNLTLVKLNEQNKGTTSFNGLLKDSKFEEISQLRPSDKIFSGSMQNIHLNSDSYYKQPNQLEQSTRTSLEVPYFKSYKNLDNNTNNRMLGSPGQSPASMLELNSCIDLSNGDLSPENSIISSNYSRRSSRSIVQTPTNLQPIKRAIELELFDSKRQQQEQGLNHGHDQAVRNSHSNKIIYFHNNHHHQRTSSSSNQSTSNSANQTSNSYRLIPVRIAYANYQSQIMFEAKRYYPKTVKLKNHSDLSKLIKIIAKVKNQLADDCRDWLYDSTTSYNLEQASIAGVGQQKQPPTPLIQAHHGVGVNRLKRHSIISNYPNDPNNKKVSLIVFTIRIDVQRVKTGQFQFPHDFDNSKIIEFLESNKKTQIVDVKAKQQHSNAVVQPILSTSTQHKVNNNNNNNDNPEQTSNGANLVKRTTLAKKCLINCENNNIPTSNEVASFINVPRQKRHVRFKLIEAPNNIRNKALNDNLQQYIDLKIEHRQWIGDSLFLSAKNDDDSTLELIDLLSELFTSTLNKLNMTKLMQ